jgi:hypothetical protein
MLTLVAVLWVVYLTDCAARTEPRTWVFRGPRTGQLRATEGADVELLAGRYSFTFGPVWPWALALDTAGTSFDFQRARERLHACERAVGPLQVAATVLFVLVMGVFCALALTDRLAAVWWIWLSAALIAWATTLVLFARARARVPAVSWSTSATVFFSPLMATRAPLVLLRHCLREFHPVCVAAATCPSQEFLRVARLWQFDAPDLRDPIAGLAARLGLLERLHAPPPLVDAGATKYCPRCHDTYLPRATRCTSCQIDLEPVVESSGPGR